MEPAHRPRRADAGQHAGPADRHVVGASALLGRGVRHPRARAVDRDGRRGVRDGAHALPRRHARGPPRPRLRRADAGGPRLGGPRAVADRRPRLAGGRCPRRRAAHGATAGCRSTPSASACSRWSRWSPSSPSTRSSTGRGSCPPTPASRCCAPAGWWAAGRCAPASRRTTPGRRAVRRAVAAREPPGPPAPAGPAAARARRRARPASSRWPPPGPRSSPSAPCTPATRRSPRSTRAIRSSRPPSPASPSIATRCPSTRCSSSRPWSRPAGTRPRRRPCSSARSGSSRPAAEPWRRLGRFRLDVLNDAPGALTALRAAYSLDPASPTSVSDVLEATRATQAPTPAAPTP